MILFNTKTIKNSEDQEKNLAPFVIFVVQIP